MWTATLLWMGLVFAIGSSLALSMRHGDMLLLSVRKSIHLTEYAVLGWLLWRSATTRNWQSRVATVAFAMAMAIAFAGLDEWHQTFIPGRSGRLLDVGIDTVGAAVGLLLASACGKTQVAPRHCR